MKNEEAAAKLVDLLARFSNIFTTPERQSYAEAVALACLALGSAGNDG